LSPIKQIAFGIYEDQKASLTGIIDNPEFETLLKKAFIRTLIMKYRNIFLQRLPIKYYRILKGDPS